MIKFCIHGVLFVGTLVLLMLILDGNMDHLWQAGAAGVVLALFGLIYHEIESYD